MSRQEFTSKTKLQAWERSGGFCECGCGQKILGRAEYDHRLPCALGGSNDLDNCVVMSSKCHRRKTDSDIGQISKADSVKKKAAGIKRPKRKMGYRKFDGTPVWPKD